MLLQNLRQPEIWTDGRGLRADELPDQALVVQVPGEFVHQVLDLGVHVVDKYQIAAPRTADQTLEGGDGPLPVVVHLGQKVLRDNDNLKKRPGRVIHLARPCCVTTKEANKKPIFRLMGIEIRSYTRAVDDLNTVRSVLLNQCNTCLI